MLDPVAARDAAAPSPTPEAVVGVLKVTVPGWIDRPQIAGRSSAGQIQTNEFARWGEPVARGVQRVVAENLAALLPTRRIVMAPFSPNQVVRHSVDITLSEAARQADGSVLVEARWALLGPRSATLVQRRTSHRVHPTAAGAAGAVTGMSEAIAELSREIAAALRALPLRPAENDPATSPGGSGGQGPAVAVPCLIGLPEEVGRVTPASGASSRGTGGGSRAARGATYSMFIRRSLTSQYFSRFTRGSSRSSLPRRSAGQGREPLPDERGGLASGP